MAGIYQRSNPVRTDEAARDRRKWAKAIGHCQACGILRAAAKRRDGGLDIECHHIIRGSRSDEPTNWLMLCHRCHGLVHDDVYYDADGSPLPRLTLGIILTVKKLRNPGEYDRDRLQQLFGYQLVDELELPGFLVREWSENQPTKQQQQRQKPQKKVAEKAQQQQKKKCARCLRLGLNIDCGNCRAANE